MKKDPKKALPYRVIRLPASCSLVLTWATVGEPIVEATSRTRSAAEKRAREVKNLNPIDAVEVQRRSNVSMSANWVTVARLCLALVVLSLSACGPDLAPEPGQDGGAQCGRAGAPCCPGAVPCLDGLRCVDLASQGWGMPGGTCLQPEPPDVVR